MADGFRKKNKIKNKPLDWHMNGEYENFVTVVVHLNMTSIHIARF